MSGAKKRVPKRRFKEFLNAGDWEQYKLADILSRRKENRRIDSAYPRLAFAAGQGVIPLSERRTNNRDQLISDEKNKKYLVTYYNDIVYNPANLKYGAIDRNKYGQGVISPIYVTFTSNICSGFIEHIVKSHEFKEKALSFEEGTVTKRQAVNPDNLLKIDVVITPNSKEQEKISKLFELIDRFITLHQHKLYKLEATKKALLQEMFPEKGQDKPKRRFKGFTDAWEQRKLSDITEVIMGQSPSSRNYTDNPNDSILVQGNADLKDGKVVPRLWTKEITKTIDKDGIILTVRAPVGDVAKTDYKVVLGRGVAGIKGNDYIYQFLQKLQNDRYWVTLSSGSTFESINSKDIKDLIINIPSKEEQTKISTLLNNVNSIITLHQRKLDKLKNLKQAYLNEMFV